ncbi:unnamed protein product [Cyprideis torosa]|uniref:Uncharacterized protein n=1 Tax=Cyprideis torosa TaxID=163714 RepID=A0A7R8W7V3_9CRUS|nr:unnamed protein product [Cyprideis torosa]CAG0883087.1 unnamed protein product [Cyprideis torosa]
MCRGSPCASAMGGVSKGAGMMAPALAVPSTRAINTRRTVSSPVLDLTRSSKRVLQGRRGSGELSPTANGGGGAWQYSSFPSMKSQGEDLLKHSSFSRILRSRKVSSTPLPKEESVMLNNNSVKDCPPTPRCPEEPPILSRDEERRAVCSGSEGEESDEEEEDDVEEESSSLLPPSILEQTTPSSLEDEGDEDDHDMHSDNLPRRRYPTLLPDASSHPVPPLPPPPSEMSPPPSPPMPPPPPTIFCSGCSSGCMEGVDHLPVPSLQKKTSIGPLPSSGCDSDNASPPPSSVGDSQTLPVVSEPPLLPTPPSPSAPPSSSSCSTSTCTSSSVSSTTISTSTTLSSSGQRPPRLTTSQLSQMVESQKQKMTALTKARSAMMDQLQELQRLSIVTREFHEINCAASAILQASTHSSSVQRSEYEHAQDRLRFARSLRHAREHFSRTWDEVEEEVTDDSSGDESVDELEGGGRCGGVPPLSSTLLGDAGAVNDPVEEDLEDLGVPRSTNAEDLPGAKPTIRDRALWNYSRKRSILSARWRFVRLQLQRMEKEREKRLKCAREFQYQKGPLLLRSSAPGAGPLFYPSAPRRRFSEVLREPSKPVAEVDDIEGAQDDSAAAAASLPPKPDDTYHQLAWPPRFEVVSRVKPSQWPTEGGGVGPRAKKKEARIIRPRTGREFQYQKGPLLLRSSAPGAGPLFYPSAPRRRFSEVLREPSKPVAEVDDIEGAQDDSAAAAASLPPKPDDGCARTRPLNRTRFKKRNLIRARRCPACSSTGLALWPCFTSFPGGASQAPPSCSWCTVSADHDYAALPPLPPPSILEAAATLDRGLHTKFSSRSGQDVIQGAVLFPGIQVAMSKSQTSAAL